MLDALEQKRLIYVTGKGGVGKSTLTAALGCILARRGRRVLVVETDAFAAMPDLLDVEAESRSDGPAPAGDGIWTQNLEASECFVKTLSRFVPSERIVRTVVQNKVARVFFNAAPSVNEFVILDQITERVRRRDGDRPRYDHVVVDLPASGHAVTFLSVPQTLQGMIKVGPIAGRAEQVAELIGDPRQTAVLAVCLPEEMPVNETLELSEQLHDQLDRGLSGVLLNMVHELPVAADHRGVFEDIVAELRRDGRIDADSIHQRDGSALDRLFAGNDLALGWHDRDQHYLSVLGDQLAAPIHAFPVVYDDDAAAIVGALVDEMDNSAFGHSRDDVAAS